MVSLTNSMATFAYSKTTEGCSRFRYQDALSQASVDLSRKHHGTSGLGPVIRRIRGAQSGLAISKSGGLGVIDEHDSHFRLLPPVDSFYQTPVERSLH
jgi:hypothetical protein